MLTRPNLKFKFLIPQMTETDQYKYFTETIFINRFM